ncbi:MAG: adenylate kinase [Chitinophagales bacterium]|jgi:adenylate kinase|nr:adenylate kinase [Bacteroidota bacterium]MBK9505622.1 adenylate kinase [Bacteroidota bacterium]MBK9556297.1 adenylate kinase [Bacteroidota bacterium]MBL0280861.1 adenylate kinase [Bacteroidota bacterium]MBP9880295.1 adenylate kinase [Chitinophagales bacterium]
MINLILFGPPGSGKGTQAEKLKAHFNLLHISTGDLLRAEIAGGTQLGLAAKQFMDEGKLVPDEVVIGMLGGAVEEAKSKGKQGIIFDGFPRTSAQAQALDNMLLEKGTSVSCVLSLVVDEEELTQRILKRGLTSGRSDDNDVETIRKRVQEYRTKTEPVAGYYKNQDLLIEIEGVGTIDTIFDALMQAVNSVSSNHSDN